MNIRAKEDLSRIFLILFDFALSSFILLFSIVAKGEFGKYGLFFIKPNEGPYFYKIWWISLFVLLVFFIKGLYSKRLPFWDEVKEMVVSILYAVLLSFSVIYLRKMWNFPRSILIFYFIFSVFAFPILRYWFKLFMAKIGLYKIKMLVIGAGEAGKVAVEGILEHKEFGIDIVGFLDDFKDGKVETKSDALEILGKIVDLENIIQKFNIDTVMIAMPSLGSEKIANLASKVQLLVKRLYIVPELKGVAISNIQIYNLFYEQIFLLGINNNLRFLRNKLIKNLFDFLLSIALLPFLLPFILILGVLIKMDSSGPVFFVQNRLGKNGKIFKCIKFRTMFVNADEILKKYLETNPEARKEWEKYKKIRGYDPRVTRIGKMLRKTSLDELPQILNVLLSDMSFVGPRPYLPQEAKKMKEYKNLILNVRPGITGLWQVSGRNKLTFKKRMELDAWYVLNWSLWLDITILLRTVKTVLKREGAF